MNKQPKKIRSARLLCCGIVGAFVACLLLAPVRPAAAFPEASIVPSSWQFEVEYQHPRAIQVHIPGELAPQTFWFMVYTVTNRTGADRSFVPELSMLTDAGDLMQANRNIPPMVYRTIREQLRNPLLKSPTEVMGRLLQGPDNAVDGVAMWRMPDHDVDRVRIFFQGLSGETHEVKDPLSGDTHLLRRALQMEYHTPGSVEQQPRKPWIFVSKRWVVR